MTNEELLDKIKDVVREEMRSEIGPINKRLDALESGQHDLQTGQ